MVMYYEIPCYVMVMYYEIPCYVMVMYLSGFHAPSFSFALVCLQRVAIEKM